MRLPYIFASVSLAAMAAMMAAFFSVGQPWTMIMTVIASSAFVATALSQFAHRGPYAYAITFGLVFCWLGDVVGPSNFFGGLIAFLLAHLGFIVAFWVRGVPRSRVLRAVLAVALVDVGIASWLLPHVSAQDRMFVLPYMAVISVMLVLALAQPSRWVASAAVVFYVSDIFVARWRFVDESRFNALFCYPLYYLACVMLALSISQASVQIKRELP